MGSFAEFVAIESCYVAKAPAALSAQAAASLPLVALTTVQGLVDRAKARKGQSILIHAGSGGLGSFAIQYAKRELGLHVTTTTSSRNAHWVRELGADVVVAYDRENYASLPARYDIVFDTLGGPTTAASFSVLKQGGSVVSVAGPPDGPFARQVGANLAVSFVMWCLGLPMALRARRIGGHYFRFLTESSGIQLERVGRVVDSGKVRAIVERIYPFSQAVEALQYATTGRAKGKLVIQVST
jgi:NADPH:quinone reductase-like Zn-dependent oxidoreductase